MGCCMKGVIWEFRKRTMILTVFPSVPLGSCRVLRLRVQGGGLKFRLLLGFQRASRLLGCEVRVC